MHFSCQHRCGGWSLVGVHGVPPGQSATAEGGRGGRWRRGGMVCAQACIACRRGLPEHSASPACPRPPRPAPRRPLPPFPSAPLTWHAGRRLRGLIQGAPLVYGALPIRGVGAPGRHVAGVGQAHAAALLRAVRPRLVGQRRRARRCADARVGHAAWEEGRGSEHSGQGRRPCGASDAPQAGGGGAVPRPLHGQRTMAGGRILHSRWRGSCRSSRWAARVGRGCSAAGRRRTGRRRRAASGCRKGSCTSLGSRWGPAGRGARCRRRRRAGTLSRWPRCRARDGWAPSAAAHARRRARARRQVPRRRRIPPALLGGRRGSPAAVAGRCR